MNLIKHAFLSFLLLAISSSVTYAQSPERRALRGVLGLRVVVEQLPSDALNAGLTRELLQTDVELRLRKAGVRIVDYDAAPFLYVKIGAMKDDTRPVYATAVIVEFLRVASFNGVTKDLKRIEFDSAATVWTDAVLGLVGSNRIRESVRQQVADSTDKFANDFLAANN